MEAKHKQLTFLLLLTSLLAACSGVGPIEGTFVWIDAPIHDLSVPLGEIITIDGHASSAEGVSRVQIWIDDETLETIDDPPGSGTLVHFEHLWKPTEPGDYEIAVVAYSSDDATSDPDTVRIHIMGEDEPEVALVTDTPEASATPTLDITPTPTSCVPNVVALQDTNCRIGPGSVYDVVGYLLTGEMAMIDGRLSDNSWWRIVNPDAAGTCWVWSSPVESFCNPESVSVLVAPPTPTPEVDNDPPPVPSLSSPVNGSELACTSYIDLVWGAVSDPSGISGYKIEVQRHPGDNNWQTVTGSPFGATGTTKNVYVECGYTYRWRVRAIDGEGNQSDWSSWFTFTILLS
jgi:hypothetical protein